MCYTNANIYWNPPVNPTTYTYTYPTQCTHSAVLERLDELMATVQEVSDSFNSYKSNVDAKLSALQSSVDSLSQDSAALDSLKAAIDAASAALPQ
jgi:hypothetical protein